MRSTAEGGDVVDVVDVLDVDTGVVEVVDVVDVVDVVLDVDTGVDDALALIFAGCTAPRSTSPRRWTGRRRAAAVPGRDGAARRGLRPQPGGGAPYRDPSCGRRRNRR
jgi:hypothetical protein